MRSASGSIRQWGRREFCAVGPAAISQAAKAAIHPNLVIFYVDQLRATALKLYRPDGVETPNLARFAAQGVRFEQAFTPHPLCVPARVSLWTGQYPHTHGSRCNEMPLDDRRPSMAGILHDAGYRLGVFGKNHCFTAQQLDRWFAADYSFGSKSWQQALSPSIATEVRKHRQWISELRGVPSSAPFSPEVFETHLATERALEFIGRASNVPFAAWISISDPHPPYQVPEEFARLAPPDKVKLPPSRDGEMKTKNTRMQIFDYLIRGPELSEGFLREFLSIYYAMILFVDSEFGRVMDLLKRKGLSENTIVLFTADHGDFAAEHHLFGKTGSMLDCLVRIPLLVSWPGRIPEGRREGALVSDLDIMPTLLGFCGLPVPQGVEGMRLPFRTEDARRSYVYSEYGNGDPEFTWEQARAVGQAKKLGTYVHSTEFELQSLANRERAGHLQMIRTLTHKLIQDSNGEIEFYDLLTDPYELENVHARPAYRALEADLMRTLEAMH